MSLFGKLRSVVSVDQIRCDEPTYLIWKWRPAGSQQGDNNRENAIRWGSSLRVKDGEVAVFVYDNNNGVMEDFIEGPFDQILETKNLPVLSSIIGLAYNGGTPFQAEVYFINLAKVIQTPFAVPYFDLFDPRYPDFGVPTAVRGKITFNIADYQEFIRLHRLSSFNLYEFQAQIKDAIARYVKGIVTNIPSEKNIPVVQIERAIEPINQAVEANVRERFGRDFGVNISAVDINVIEIDKTSEGYRQLKAVTQDLAADMARAQSAVNIKDLYDAQRINARNMEETLRIQREEAQYAQHKQTQMSNFEAYRMEQQASVGRAGAEALGRMGANGAAKISGGAGMDPAAMMAGMAIGSTVGRNIAGMMNEMMQDMNVTQQPGSSSQKEMGPPPVPGTSYYVVIGGQSSGPYDIGYLSQMVSAGTVNRDSLVWKRGMADWTKAGTVRELQPIFDSSVPPVPGSTPPIPPA